MNRSASRTTSPDALYRAASIHLRKHELAEARSLCARLIRKHSHFAPGWFLASRMAQVGARPDLAKDYAVRACELDSSEPRWQVQLAQAMLADGERAQAERLIESLRGVRFDTVAAEVEFAQLCTDSEHYELARDAYARAIERAPHVSDCHYNIATLHRFLGDFKEAEASCEVAIELNPTDYNALFLRSEVLTQTPDRNHVDELKDLLSRPTRSWTGEVQLCFALSKEYEDLGDFKASFAILKRGCAVRRKHLTYDVQADLDIMDAIEQGYDGGMMQRNAGGGLSTEEPIFVLGLPRTGTTLVEQMLTRHRDVFAAGELTHFSQAISKLVQSQFGEKRGRGPTLVLQSTLVNFGNLGRTYLESTRPRTGNTPRFIDKMPINFLYCGPIELALPLASIVHVNRDPLDACYAILKCLFDRAYPYSYDLTELAKYYIGYRALMAHWESVMPGRIHDVSYETLVSDPETSAAALLSACGLPQKGVDAESPESGAAVTTASAAQVRRPPHRGSIGKSRHLLEELAPLIERLELAGIL